MRSPLPRAVADSGAANTRSPERSFGPVQVLRHTGLAAWQWDAARAGGLIPAPDVDGGRWSQTTADQVAAQAADIVAAFGQEPPIGAARAAGRLAGRCGVDVERADVQALTDAGLLNVAGSYKTWPLWDCRALDVLDPAHVHAILAQRHAWEAISLSRWDAAAYLGWRTAEFDRVAAERRLQLGPQERYPVADLDALHADEDLAEQVAAERLLMAHQAAVHLEIRPSDFRWLLAADLLTPRRHTSVQVARFRRVDVPLYRAGDLDALRQHPDIDWNSLHAVRPGEPSPLRHLAHRSPDRAAVIRRAVAELADRYGREVWAWWNNNAGIWEIDYERDDQNHQNEHDGLDVEEFTAAIDGHPTLSEHRDAIAVATRAGAAMRWARAMRQPGSAVILDTETTDLDGYVIEVAVLDAATGHVLLDTLINPGCAVEPGAQWVHGITDEQLVDAPTLRDIWPQLLAATAGRTVLAYNADFDHTTLTRHATRDGLDLAHLASPQHWSCLMNRRSAWRMRHRRLALEGGHRARADCQRACELLIAMTNPAPRALTF